MNMLPGLFSNGSVDYTMAPAFLKADPSSVALEDYRTWFKLHGVHFNGSLTDCDMEAEMQKVKMGLS